MITNPMKLKVFTVIIPFTEKPLGLILSHINTDLSKGYRITGIAANSPFVRKLSVDDVITHCHGIQLVHIKKEQIPTFLQTCGIFNGNIEFTVQRGATTGTGGGRPRKTLTKKIIVPCIEIIDDSSDDDLPVLVSGRDAMASINTNRPKQSSRWIDNGDETLTIAGIDVFHVEAIKTFANAHFEAFQDDESFKEKDPGEQVVHFLQTLMKNSNDCKTLAIARIDGEDQDELDVIHSVVTRVGSSDDGNTRTRTRSGKKRKRKKESKKTGTKRKADATMVTKKVKTQQKDISRRPKPTESTSSYPNPAPGPFTGMSFAFTGVMPNLSRANAIDYVISCGGRVLSSGVVTRATDYLVTG